MSTEITVSALIILALIILLAVLIGVVVGHRSRG
jgi:hypothetical protein